MYLAYQLDDGEYANFTPIKLFENLAEAELFAESINSYNDGIAMRQRNHMKAMHDYIDKKYHITETRCAWIKLLQNTNVGERAVYAEQFKIDSAKEMKYIDRYSIPTELYQADIKKFNEGVVFDYLYNGDRILIKEIPQ